MDSIAYSAMLEQIDKGAYTEITAKNTIANLYARQQITTEEYNDLMDRADTLAANTPDGDVVTRIIQLEFAVQELRESVELLKQTIEEAGSSVPSPELGQAGSSEDPIDAVRSMTYYKDKYYYDPEDGQVYKCIRDSDTEPGTGVALYYLPHELVNIYFTFGHAG